MDACVSIVSLAAQIGCKPDRLRELAMRRDDPLPARLLPGSRRGQFVLVSELEEWMGRNAPMIGGGL